MMSYNPRLERSALEVPQRIPGDDESRIERGGSAIIGPDTEYGAGPVYEEACNLYGEVRLDQIFEGHLAHTDGDYARSDVFHLQVNDRPQPGVTLESTPVVGSVAAEDDQ